MITLIREGIENSKWSRVKGKILKREAEEERGKASLAIQ